MARRKTLPESLRAKLALAERLSSLRLELFGDRGGPEMARRLEIPVRTWYNYEGGVTVPAEVVLRIIELTSVEPVWLLHGKGPKYRQQPRMDQREVSPRSSTTVGPCCGPHSSYSRAMALLPSPARKHSPRVIRPTQKSRRRTPPEKNGSRLSRRTAAFRSRVTPWPRSWPTGLASRTRSTRKTLVSLTARWSWHGSTTSRSFAG